MTVYGVVNGILLAVQCFLLFYWIYYLFVSMFGFGAAKRQKEHNPQKRFLIMIPAHNEENVIGQLVKNCQQLEYPKELYDICVIADNCTDDTSSIARELGAHVIEHTSPKDEPKGKPYGIRYATEQYGDRLQEDYDGIVFFDADNLVSLNFLQEMNNHLCNGDRLVQAYLDSKNPDDNLISLGYASSYYFMNRSWQLAKSRIGLGNAIGGTGFCVCTKLFKEVGWTARSLTEDLEFTMQCLLKGVPAKWNHFARVYDEKPSEFKASVIQRLRWARGHWDVASKYTFKLLGRAITKGDVKALDGAIYLFNPGKIVLNALTTIIVTVALVTGEKFYSLAFPWQVWIGMILFQLVYILYTRVIDTNQKINVFKMFISMIFFNLVYIPLFFWSLITMKDKTWKRTEHTRAIDIQDLGK
ncbi:glycosyltransferase family 2 protein [Priestia taiwanensis]|uniref:Glycosyl transferase family 2 n=1 Tax=Priestia taiwanensis TaxID=1347902 RepID=A0A917EQZ9_9BACI|nr:glycosyltransferase family 2 protein [Priestia taiwanensis]MBM7365215.1 cellulose synthase/poly-beta-1,6-N-acetylglucosamine synthase-like glycosyltransferase [Priestia taiwanensis]GGE73633.1 glycosyl transferase family 2 [Priestia taiwanensis]